MLSASIVSSRILLITVLYIILSKKRSHEDNYFMAILGLFNKGGVQNLFNLEKMQGFEVGGLKLDDLEPQTPNYRTSISSTNNHAS